ncbi:MAG: hypothetical protein MUO26_00420 [Methanotrichaceae archaeon]|nr:hypothetical protein [Methanotrichaceae archaeon]
MNRCKECGTDSKPIGAVLCDECKENARKERDRKRYLKNRTFKIDPNELIIVNDPDPLALFYKGARITKEQMKCMCSRSIHSFTVGTILKDYTGTLYRVIALPDESQKLILI